MDDLINQVTSVVTTWEQAGVVAGLIALVMLLTNITKLPSVAAWVPTPARSWVAVVLGALAGFLAAISTGRSYTQAVMSGLVIGLGAIGAHEVTTNAVPMVKALKVNRMARKLAKAATVGLLLTCMVMSCNTVSQVPTDAKDCAEQEAKVTDLPGLIANATLAIIAAAAGDWSKLEALALQYGEPLVACITHDLGTKPNTLALKVGAGSGEMTLTDMAVQVIVKKGWHYRGNAFVAPKAAP